MSLTALSDDELMAGLQALHMEGRRLLARLVLHLVEIEERRLHLKAACSSMFDFCVRQLGMSEGAAFRRINAARLVRRFPQLVERIESGAIHLSALVMLRDHLSEANVEELTAAASGKSKREVEELLARHAPRPDVPATLRKLPATRPPVATAPLAPSCGSTEAAAAPARASEPARLEPLAPARYKLQLTASAELRDKLERARALMSHRNHGGDLAAVVEAAVDALLVKLEKERLGKTARPRRQVDARAAQRGRVARAVRREVFERDGEQCTFVDDAGHRCPARAFLELDHVDSRALGGPDDAENLRVLCRAHNRLHAEEVFGAPHIARHIHVRQQKSRLASRDANPAHVRQQESRLGSCEQSALDLRQHESHVGSHEQSALDLRQEKARLGSCDATALHLRQQESRVGSHEQSALDLRQQESRLGSCEQSALDLRQQESRLGSCEQSALDLRQQESRLGSCEQSALDLHQQEPRVGSYEQSALDLRQPKARLGSCDATALHLRQQKARLGSRGATALHLRQRKSRLGSCETSAAASDNTSPPAHRPDSFALAARGLKNMGFRDAEVRQALVTVNARHGGDVDGKLPIEDMLREALAVLT